MPPVDPIISYYGGKQGLIPDLLPLFPRHKTYVEVFGGSGAVLLAKPPSAVEVYNDVDFGPVNLHRVVQMPDTAERLRQALLLTPNSRREHAYCRDVYPSGDPVELARQYVVLIRQSYSSIFKGCWGSSKTMPGNHFRISAHRIRTVGERLRHVRIENRHFRELFPLFDAPDTLWYLDPPYVGNTRVCPDVYQFELTNQEHVELLDTINHLTGMVILSGYGSALYDRTLLGWRQIRKRVVCSSSPAWKENGGTKPMRTEVIWVNPAAQAALPLNRRMAA